MAKGRPKKPTAIKQLQGTLEKSREVPNQLQSQVIISHDPPSELNEWGIKLWNDLFDEWGHIGLITRMDLGSIFLMCNEFGTYCEADDLIKAQGLEIEVDVFNLKGELTGKKKEVNPILRVRDNAAKQYKMFCVEFGLTPVSRSKISAPKQNEGKDELEELLT